MELYFWVYRYAPPSYAQTSLYRDCPVNDVLDAVLYGTSTIVGQKDGKFKRLNG